MQNRLFSFLIIISMTARIGSLYAQPDSTVKGYLAAIKVQDWELAESYWVKSEIERSRRLGIKFENIEAKYDCASPLITNPHILNDPGYKLNFATESLDSISTRIDIAIVGLRGDTLRTSYYLSRESDRRQLCSPMYIFTDNWYMIKTRYFNLTFTDSSLINNVAIDALDNFTDSLGQILSIPLQKMALLEERKIDYYLCTGQQVQLLTGYDAHGVTSFPFDAIIARHLPHPHEITHLMTNFALQELPLFTLPVLQEGIACCLGGRWGKSPEAINYWGSVALSLGLARLDDILTGKGWGACAGGADAAYAISSLLARTLINRYGAEKFLQVYHALSGNSMQVNAFSQRTIRMTIENICGESWAELASAFAYEAANYRYCGITPEPQMINEEHLAELNDGEVSVKIFDVGDSYYFEITLNDLPTGAAILFEADSLNTNPNYRSWQFEEQFDDGSYKGEVYGLLFSPAEAGLYDYLTNCLIAKYVSGFVPDESYYDPGSHKLTFSLDKSMLPKDISHYGLRLVNLN